MRSPAENWWVFISTPSANSWIVSPSASANGPTQCCCAQLPDATAQACPACTPRVTTEFTGPVPSPGPLWM